MYSPRSSSTCLTSLLVAAGLLLSAAALAAPASSPASALLAAGAGGSQPSASGSGNAGGSGTHASGSAGSSSSCGSAGNAAGGATAGGNGGAAAAAGGAAAGQKLFQSAMPPCSTCHQAKAGVNQPGPSLAGVAARAKQRIAAKDYKGKARDARSYIRESIMDPNAYIVPGQGYATGGQSLMPKTYAQSLKPEQIEELVNYVMSLK